MKTIFQTEIWIYLKKQIDNLSFDETAVYLKSNS